jgi:hypothetical protein
MDLWKTFRYQTIIYRYERARNLHFFLSVFWFVWLVVGLVFVCLLGWFLAVLGFELMLALPLKPYSQTPSFLKFVFHIGSHISFTHSSLRPWSSYLWPCVAELQVYTTTTRGLFLRESLTHPTPNTHIHMHTGLRLRSFYLHLPNSWDCKHVSPHPAQEFIHLASFQLMPTLLLWWTHFENYGAEGTLIWV